MQEAGMDNGIVMVICAVALAVAFGLLRMHARLGRGWTIVFPVAWVLFVFKGCLILPEDAIGGFGAWLAASACLLGLILGHICEFRSGRRARRAASAGTRPSRT
ncbi:hypothetical protein FKV24_016470 [Lysobacter maris]|uniref:Uncharacterized protein n=2 Tax=Marilutibacter maris TaxID=1605891 RepID=A0A5N6AII8_9GAMM|nr:hypothetical protein FKV24_016470 [Lysobacter maris]